MSELIEKLKADFQDEDYRHSYAEECLNTMVATQIKVLREQRDMTQGELAERTGMRQPRIPLLEDSTYSSWTINTLKRIARACDVALSVKFETFSKVILDFEALSRESLQRPNFANDPLFQNRRAIAIRRLRRRRGLQTQREALSVPGQAVQTHLFEPRGQLIEWPTPHNGELAAVRKALAPTLQGEAHAAGVGGAR